MYTEVLSETFSVVSLKKVITNGPLMDILKL